MAWFDAIAEATAAIECLGEQHRISWRRGKLVLHDHRLRDEEVVLALGGTPPSCVAVLLGWRDSRSWAAGSRPHPPGFIRRMPPPYAPPELAPVRRLGVVRAWERRWRRASAVEEAEDIYRLLRARALPTIAESLDRSRRQVGGGRPSFVEVRLIKLDGDESVDGRIDADRSSLVVTLAPAWLYEVDVAGATTSDGSFRVAPGRVIRWREAAAGRWEPEIGPELPA